ncbi:MULTISPECIES: nucleoside diphosphate kinase regulator [Thalassotalea]|uniref:Nucleoside diphosphate kinase regulator n=1 Tax=Thalassotalea castellviae TaxID=3075612 RepID=A0ABU3A687_9GAMM|nr:nucleoside diphosphate kinase regulator [Thalassotalea sp. W431]MDT0604603.1 nucleoside diphosphate kinase regulator [Thalassotalea sp. W431]
MKPPKITICSKDYDDLYDLLENEKDESSFKLLRDELNRAHIVNFNELPSNVVRMNSTVKFTVQDNQECFSLKLVYPQEVKNTGTISILSPVGSALLGLSIGQEIEWPLIHGQKTVVHIDAIH